MFDVRLITIKGAHDGDVPAYSEFSERQWDYLVGRLDPHPAASATVCVWELQSKRWLLPPEYLAEYRRRVIDGDRSLLAVSYRYNPDLDWQYLDEKMFDEQRSPLQRRMDLAWRLERHWIVEWADREADELELAEEASAPQERDRERRRPPVAFLSEDAEPVLLGGDLSPKLRPASAALAAFHFVTADELRAAFRALGEKEPSASDLSRVLTYFEETGWLIEAPDRVASAYWRQRGAVGRRPLRLFQSVLADAGSWTGEYRKLGLQRIANIDHAIVSELMPSGLPSKEPADHLSAWKDAAQDLRKRGLRTV